MIVKGTSVKTRRHAAYLAKHLLNANDNEICEVWDIDGHAKPNDLRAAIMDYYDMVNLTRGGKNGLFMISINPEKGEAMDKEKYFQSIAEAEKMFGLEGQPKAVVRHFKEGRDHIHVVWQTTDTDTRKIKPNIYYYKRKCMRLARDLERELGHKPVSSEKSYKSYSEKERAQAKIDAKQLKPDDRKRLVQEAYTQAKNSKEFSKHMEAIGLQPAKGRVGICLVDSAGQSYNLEKEMKKKVTQEELTKFFAKEKLPEVGSIEGVTKERKRGKKTKEKTITGDQVKKARYVNYDFDSMRAAKKKGEARDNSIDVIQPDTAQEERKAKLEEMKRQAEEFRERMERKRKRPGWEL